MGTEIVTIKACSYVLLIALTDCCVSRRVDLVPLALRSAAGSRVYIAHLRSKRGRTQRAGFPADALGDAELADVYPWLFHCLSGAGGSREHRWPRAAHAHAADEPHCGRDHYHLWIAPDRPGSHQGLVCR